MAERSWSIYLDASDWEGETDVPGSEINGRFVESEVRRLAASDGFADDDFVYDPEGDGVAVFSLSETKLRALVRRLVEEGSFLDDDLADGIAESEEGFVLAVPADQELDGLPLMDGPWPDSDLDSAALQAYLFSSDHEAWADLTTGELLDEVVAALRREGLQDRLVVREYGAGALSLDGTSIADFRKAAASLGMAIDEEASARRLAP